MHSHKWTFVCRGTGQFRKDNWPEDYFQEMPGTIERCDCKTWRIIPFTSEFSTVEIEPYEEKIYAANEDHTT